MTGYDARHIQPCECCGRTDHGGLTPYGEADRNGHTWTHYVCDACRAGCTSDVDGNPVHVGKGDGADQSGMTAGAGEGRASPAH